MNIKVKQTKNLDGRIVTKGKLVLLNYKDIMSLHSTFNKDSIIGREGDELPLITIKPIIISEEEKITINDWYIDETNQIRQSVIDDEDYWNRRENYHKILALPEHFSPEILQMIVNEDLKDGQDLWVECEEPRVIARFNHTFEGEYFVKLTDNHINIFPILQNPQLKKALDIYIKEKHTQEECIGFIDGFEKAQENKMFSLDDMKKACVVGIDICSAHNPEIGNDFKPFEDLINSLNK